MPEHNEESRPRPTDWNGHTKEKDNNIDLTKHIPAGILALLFGLPGLYEMIQNKPDRNEVRMMIKSESPYTVDREHIRASLQRLENVNSDASKASLEAAKAIVVMSTRMDILTTEISSLRKDVNGLRDWWFTPPKKNGSS